MMVDCFSRLLFPKLIPLFFQGAGWFQLFQLLMTFLVSEKVECICLCFFLVTGHVHFVHEKREWSRAGFFWMLWVFQVLGTLICWLDFLNELIYFNWRLIILQYCGGFCHTLTWISHGCSCVLHPEPFSNLPPHPIPQHCPNAPALSALFHAPNLDWWSISHMVIYMFQCYSFNSSHLLPSPMRITVVQMPILPKETYRFNTIPINE